MEYDKYIHQPQEPQPNSPSAQWLADLRAQPDFSAADEQILMFLEQSDFAESMFTVQQQLRLKHIELSGGTEDIIDDQLRVLRNVFGQA